VINHGEESIISLADDGLLVVSGGGVKTPQLLLESGIGPGLEGVKNEYVGKKLSDKPIREHTFEAAPKDNIKKYDLDSPPEEDLQRFLEKGEGPLSQFGALLVGMIDPDVVEDDERHNLVEFFVNPALDDARISVFLVHLTPKSGNGAIILDASTGKATRNWASQWDAEYTKQSLNNAFETLKGAMEEAGYPYIKTDLTDGMNPINGMNHPGGTCEMDKCMDSETLLVKGLDNVAVCDNSIIPEQAIVHTAFTLMAMSLHGADILKDFWNKDNIADRDEL